jgi:hypothetical protein
VVEHGARERDFEDAEGRRAVEEDEGLVGGGAEADEAGIEDVQEEEQDDGYPAHAVQQPGPVALAATVAEHGIADAPR